jgi:phosphoadenosine phosphosulfate reductase
MYTINQNKIDRSVALLKEFEPYEGYHLAFSGGKDSICIYHLAKTAGVKFKAYYSMTSVDPPDIISFIKKFFPDVEFLRPKYSMFQLIGHKRLLPTRNMAFCCEHLKEYAGNGGFVVQGIRWEESFNRSKRNFFEVDDRKKMKGKKYLNPIIGWTKNDVWDYIKINRLPFPDLYLGCFSRVGCIGCPKARARQRKRELQLYPRYKKAYLLAIEKAQRNGGFRDFESPGDAFEWWISGKKKKVWQAEKKQLMLGFG